MDFSTNYFDLFDLPQGFEVDQSKLTQQYRQLQMQFHPDKYAGKSAQQQRLAEQYTAFINQAFVSLKDPLTRAQYLLSLKDVDSTHENSTHQESAFLIEQMELRETLSEVRESDRPFEKINKLAGLVSERLAELYHQFALTYNEADFENAREHVAKMQFFNKLHREIEALEAELEELT